VIDIQSENFIRDFKMSDATVGQIGYGFIGNAVVELFRTHVNSVMIYDKAKSGSMSEAVAPGAVLCSDIDGVVNNAEVIFVAVPTPMKPTGECHTGIVESVLQDIQNAAIKLRRDISSFIVVIKSTVPAGFTQRMQDRFALRIVFSPEFLTEANAVADFKNTNRVLLGGDLEDCRVVFKYFEGVWPDRMMETFVDHPAGPVHIIQCDPTVAEMVKLSTNVHLTARVMISNEIYLLCQKLGVEYDDVKMLTQLDRRIGVSHMNVPGPDKHLGYGGHCFVKDTQNLAWMAESLGTASKHGQEEGPTSLFGALHRRNLDIREDRDWESQEGRAVIKE
jgi:nucleotide sugar dehydrogenase